MTRTHGRVNLLIVLLLGVLAFVVWMLWFPTFAGDGRAYALRVRCVSQIKQLGTAAQMYLADYDNRIMHRDHWMDQLEPYHKNDALLHCPGLVEEPKASSNIYGYAMNGKLSMENSAKIADLVDMPLMYDSVSLWRNASDSLQSLPEPPRLHGTSRATIVGFLDGHARVFRTNAEIPGTQL